ncbi:MAG: hypothetical protein LBO75_05085 [Bifidobacteriaceae bacterium]|nr:hypothetical protein [Bifidobacteriaceae bacterium]
MGAGLKAGLGMVVVLAVATGRGDEVVTTGIEAVATGSMTVVGADSELSAGGTVAVGSSEGLVDVEGEVRDSDSGAAPETGSGGSSGSGPEVGSTASSGSVSGSSSGAFSGVDSELAPEAALRTGAGVTLAAVSGAGSEAGSGAAKRSNTGAVLGAGSGVVGAGLGSGGTGERASVRC